MFDGKATKAARRNAGLTGQALAGLVGVTNVTISRIENQHQAPGRDLAERIAEALGVDFHSLYVDNPIRAIIMPDLSEEERDILLKLRQLDRTGRAKVWGFVMGLASGGSLAGAEAAAELAQAAEEAQQTSEAQANKQAKRA